MTQRDYKGIRCEAVTKALGVRQKHKLDLKQKKKKNTSNYGSDESMAWRVWSDLPDDLLRQIIGKLCWSDRIRWRGVCKSMQSLLPGIEQTIDKFPWLMSYNWRTNYSDGRVYNSIYKLADSSAQKCYVMKKAVKRELVHAVACASRNGWVLFQKLNLFYFYSPFTNEVIKLPEFDYTDHIKATFSSTPTSLDCVVLIWSVGYNKVRISTWSPGDKNWTHSDLYRQYSRALDVIYGDGIFYCIFEDGKLGAYDDVLQEWKLFEDALPVNVKLRGVGSAATAYLIESNEDKDVLLMCVFLGHCELWRFDLSMKCWVEEQRIGNRAIFLGCTSYSVPAVGRSSEFGDKIYCLEEISRNKEPKCGFLEDRTHWCQTQLYSWMPKIGAEKLIWIQPPLQ